MNDKKARAEPDDVAAVRRALEEARQGAEEIMTGPVSPECMEVVFFLMDHIDAAILQLDKHEGAESELEPEDRSQPGTCLSCHVRSEDLRFHRCQDG